MIPDCINIFSNIYHRDLLANIFLFLDIHELLDIALVCKHWNDTMNSNIVWGFHLKKILLFKGEEIDVELFKNYPCKTIYFSEWYKPYSGFTEYTLYIDISGNDVIIDEKKLNKNRKYCKHILKTEKDINYAMERIKKLHMKYTKGKKTFCRLNKLKYEFRINY